MTRNGVPYLRATGIHPGKVFQMLRRDPPQGSTDFLVPMWVYDGSDIVSQNIVKLGAWEPTESVMVLEALASLQQVGFGWMDHCRGEGASGVGEQQQQGGGESPLAAFPGVAVEPTESLNNRNGP